MQRALTWSLASALAVACALPGISIDDSLAGSGGSGGKGGSTGGTGMAGKPPLPGNGGTGPLMNGGQAGGASDDPRELACGDYCTTYLKNCLNAPANTYDDIDDCLNTCFNSDWPFGTDNAEPNSVQCRVLHAHLARDLPDPHCFHSAEFPTGTSCAIQP